MPEHFVAVDERMKTVEQRASLTKAQHQQTDKLLTKLHDIVLKQTTSKPVPAPPARLSSVVKWTRTLGDFTYSSIF